MYFKCLAFNLMWIFGVAWQIFSGVDHDDGEDDNEGDFDWSRKEYIGDVNKLDWLNVPSPTLGTGKACPSSEAPYPLGWKLSPLWL